MQVQKPVRYYITKSGDQPTVRSVAVALPVAERDARAEHGATAPAVVAAPDGAERSGGVTSRVKSAIKRRPAPQ